MHRLIAALLALPVLFCCRDAGAAAPPQLHGKSIVVSWTYNFMLRRAGTQAPFRSQAVAHRMSIYVSSAGRPFVRHSATSPGGSGATEKVGTSGLSKDNGPRQVLFQGSSLVILGGQPSSATQIKIDFDASFGSCTASATWGRQASVGTFTFKSISTNQMIEAQSVSTSGATCSIKDGNVFAE